MEVVLLENIENLGALGEKVSVKSGFGRNYLLPKGKAKIATAANLAELEAIRTKLEKAAADSKLKAEARLAAISALGNIQITAKTGTEGKLFGSVGTADIAEALTAAGHAVEKREVRLPEGVIRSTGEHQVIIHLYTDIDAVVNIIVVSENQT